MTRDELKLETMRVLQDPSVEESLDDWIEQERRSIAAEFELPALRLHEPVVLPVTTSAWLYPLPTTFQKKLFRVRNSAGTFIHNIYTNLGRLDVADFDHDQTGTYVSQVAYEDLELGVYPKANDTLFLWYYAKPAPLLDDDSIPDEIPEAFHLKVLLPRLVLRAFRVYPELSRNNIPENRLALDLWRTRLKEGLYGSRATGEIGMIDFFGKSKPPRIHGGRQPLP